MIANYLNRNKPALENMLAEVRSQSADDLVDGLTSAEERRYSYNHYYGSRLEIPFVDRIAISKEKRRHNYILHIYLFNINNVALIMYFLHTKHRRQGEDNHAHRDFAEDGGFLCPSEVKYARPQLAQTSRGVWKYIINMAEHTQTIRMERCLYVLENLKALAI